MKVKAKLANRFMITMIASTSIPAVLITNLSTWNSIHSHLRPESYSGLETLKVTSTSFSTIAQSDSLTSYRFYNAVLPKHVNSIRVLNIQCSYEEAQGWCYNLDDIPAVLGQCNKLRSLSVALTSSTVVATPE